MSKPKLALIPSGYKSGKVYSILPNDATGDFDFTRQSIGTRVRKDGLIEEAKTSGSITNLILNSEDFSTNWSVFNGASISADQTLAPDGTNTADKIVSNGTNYSFTRPTSNITVTNAKYYTASIYVKADVETVGYLRCDYGTLIYNRKFDLTAGTLSTGFDNITNIPENERIEELANGWYRISITDVVDTISFEMRVYCSDGSASSGDSLFLWGAMVSEGALSDYIKTEGSSETKRVETFTDVPRLDWLNSNCPSLLLEPQRTNLILYSEEFTGSNWGTLNTLINSDTVISPNGTMTANTLQRTSTSASYRSHNISKSASSITYTTSTFIKKGSDNYFSMRAQGSYPSRVDIRFRFDTEQIYSATAFSNFTILDYGVQNYSNGWYRMHFTYTSDTHTNLSITFSPRATNGNIDSSDTSSTSFAYVWGAQTEVGSYVSSYIKTEASTVTRLKDECLNGGDSDLFNITEGTFFVDANNFGTPLDDYSIITLSDGGNNFVRFIYESSRIRATVYNGAIQSDYFITGVNDNERNKVAITFKENEFKTYLNGVLKDTDTIGVVPTNFNRLNFANNGGTARHFEGKVYDARVYDRVLTEAEAIEITTL
jgi:hypothetical protein